MITNMFEYNLWANTRLIELCGQLTADQLTVEASGVFGRIQPTLVHLIRAEGGYLRRLTGAAPWGDDLDWDNMPMSELLAKAQLSGQQLVEVASKVDPEQSHTITAPWGKPFTFYNWTVVLQALYHGIEHRTQIKMMLTQLGVEHPDLEDKNYLESFPVNQR
ncbi:MAG: DinB family protein [Anaerolineales bacterium]|nr:DinB family protein [Anaerolineales bacterium]